MGRLSGFNDREVAKR